MKTFREYLDDIIGTANVGTPQGASGGPSDLTKSAVGTRIKRLGDGPDSFRQGVPGKSPKKSPGKVEKMGMLVRRQVPEPFGGVGQYINVPQTEDEKK